MKKTIKLETIYDVLDVLYQNGKISRDSWYKRKAILQMGVMAQATADLFSKGLYSIDKKSEKYVIKIDMLQKKD
jgi:hypothetical protein